MQVAEGDDGGLSGESSTITCPAAPTTLRWGGVLGKMFWNQSGAQCGQLALVDASGDCFR